VNFGTICGRSFFYSLAGSAVFRKLLAVLILLGVISWLVLSYLPPGMIVLPAMAFSPSGLSALFPALLVAAVIVFAAIQLWLVWSTVKSLRTSRLEEAQGLEPRLKLNIFAEALWTALPLVGTLVLVVVGYRLWVHLTTP
jgi:heme/copper-type cytochrome/quinol oxidase subunit 2